MTVITGTNGNDNLVGTFRSDTISPLLGNDTANGGFGVDTLIVDYTDAYVDPYAGAAPAASVSTILSNGGSFSGSITTVGGPNRVSFSNIEVLRITFDKAGDLVYLDGAALAHGASINFDGGPQMDTLEADFSSLSSVNLQVNGGTATASFGIITNFEVFRLTLTSGADTVTTGSGNDVLTGGGGNDTLNSGGGNDTLNGGSGSNSLTAGDGDDQITSEGADAVDGGIGFDRWTGDYATSSANLAFTFNPDTRSGSLSNGTTLTSIEGISLTTGSGNDTFTFPVEGSFVVAAGAGNDTLTIVGFAWGGSIVADGAGAFGGSIGYGIFSGIEHLNYTGTGWDEVFNVAAAPLSAGASLSLDAAAGSDTLAIDFTGLGGLSFIANATSVTTNVAATLLNFETYEIVGSAFSDKIVLIDGNDSIDGGAGADDMTGGQGNDTYFVDNIGDQVHENLGEGTDIVETNSGSGATLGERQANAYVLPNNVENLVGTGDAQGLRGNDLDNHITAGSGSDFVNAADGGSDYVISGDGRDVIYYGATLDNSDFNNAGDEVSDPRGDLLVIQGDYSAGLTLGDNALIDVEKFRMLKGENSSFGDTGGNSYSYEITTVDANVAFEDRLVVQGGSLQLGEHLKFDGSAETDGSFQMFGGHDSDILIGGAQGDHLLGRSGDDTLTGNGGDDRLRGGLGADAMDGGSGSDIFVYAAQAGAEAYSNPVLESTGAGHDTINGFDFASDKIDLPQTVSALASLNTGALNDASFNADLAAAVDGALVASGAVLFTADGGDLSRKTFLIVDADGDGSYQADHDYVIQLVGATGTVPATPDFF